MAAPKPKIPGDCTQRLLDLYRGGNQAHIISTGTGEKDDNGKTKADYLTVHKPAGARAFRDHLAGTTRLAIIPINKGDDLCWFGTIDNDDYNIDPTVWQKRVIEVGLPLLVSRTKSGGTHLDLFLKEPIPAKRLRALLSKWAAVLGCTKGVEIFPKQETLPDDKTGNGVNLPYYDVDSSLAYGLDIDGKALDLTRFIDLAEDKRISVDDAEAIKLPKPKIVLREEERQRNNTLWKIGAAAKGRGADKSEILPLLQKENQKLYPDDPLPDAELRECAEHSWMYADAPEDDAAVVQELNGKHAVVSWSGKTVVINKEWDEVFSRHMISKSSFADFTNFYSNRFINKKALGAYWLKHSNRRQYKGIFFKPNGARDGYYNLWHGFAFEPKPGDWSLMKDHIRDNLCSGVDQHNEYLLNIMARTVQKPDSPGEVAVVLKGERGTGKGIYAREFGGLLGQHFLQIAQARHLTGNFNAHLWDTVLLFADEAFWAGDKQGENVLKALITEPDLVIERKGVDVITAKNYIHLIIASNNEWTIPAGPHERRFFVLKVSDKHRQDMPYFKKIVSQMKDGGREAMLHELLNRDISGFDVRRVPKTAELLEQQFESLDPMDSWWLDKLMDARLFPDDDGSWTDRPPSARLFTDFCKQKKPPAHQIKSFQTKLGLRLQKSWGAAKSKNTNVTYYVPTDRLDDLGERITVKEIGSVYWLRPLEGCRAAFEKYLGQPIDWPGSEQETVSEHLHVAHQRLLDAGQVLRNLDADPDIERQKQNVENALRNIREALGDEVEEF